MEIIRRHAITSLLLGLFACSVTNAQQWYDYAPAPREFDWQWFAPVEPYGSDDPVRQTNGYFFSANRMHSWLSTPKRTHLGNPTTATPGNEFAAVLSNVDRIYQVYAQGFDDTFGTAFNGVTPTSILATGVLSSGLGHQFSSIDDSNPDTNTGWGNRFEFGWMQNQNNCGPTTGWMVGIIDQIEMSYTYQVGFDDKRLNQLGAAQGTDGVDGDLDAGTAPVAPVAGIQAIPSVDGLLTTHVNFDDPFGLLLTFVDSLGEFQNFGTPLDLNGNGTLFEFGDANLGIGDQLPVAVVFDQIEVTNSTEISGIEVMAMRRKRQLHNGSNAEVFFGARYFEMDDRFFVEALGGVLGDSVWQNNAVNRVAGAQVGFRVSKQTRRWSSSFDARFTAGTNFLEIDQNGVLADHTTTGIAVGGFAPAAFGGMDVRNSFRETRFSPMGEIRWDTSFQVTRAIKLSAGWQGLILGNVARASNTVDYVFPTLGIRDREEDVMMNSITLGLEMTM